MFSSKTATRAGILLLLTACTGDSGSPLAPDPAGPGFEISDAAHAGAVPGFYFLPPMVPEPTFSGTFDGALSPRVEVCELAGSSCGPVIAQYTMTSGTGSELVRVDATNEHYAVNWHTDQFNLDIAKHYRISVHVGSFQLGFADFDPVSTGKELKNVDTQEYIPLVDGRTLPIKFRIETGIVAAVAVSPASATIETGQTQQFTAALTDLHGNPVSAPVAWTVSDPGVATIDGAGLATGVAPGTVTVTATSGGASGSASLTVLDPNTAPVAAADNFEAIGNVTVPVAAPGVLANDTDAENHSLSVAAPGSYTTANGGTVTLNADGSFTYLSPAGFTGTDSFDYAASDGSLASATVTVQVSVGSRVWYVRNDGAAPGDGRDASPFTTLKAAETASSAGETIFLLAGNGTTSGYDEGIVLKAGQALTGQGLVSSVTASLNGQTVVLLAAGSTPQVTRSTAGPTVQLATDNTVQGVSIASTAGAGIAGSSFGTLTAGSLSVSAVGGPALDLQNGTAAAAFSSLSSTNSGTTGLRLHGLSGTLTAAGGNVGGATAAGVDISGGTADIGYAGNISNAVDHAVAVTGRTGGTVTFSGNLQDTGAGVLVQNNTGGTIAFTGASKVLDTGASPAVTLLSNTGANIQFAGGGLSLTTTTATAFGASGGGTVQVTGANNAIGTTSGTALSVVNTTIGTSGVTFRSISAGNGTSGIVLENTGSVNGLQVTGTGTAGSGGTIQGMSGSGIALTNATNVRLSYMSVTGNAGSGLNASSVTGLMLTSLNVQASGDAGLHLNELGGTNSITGTEVSGSTTDNVRVSNATATLGSLSLSGCTIRNNNATSGGAGIAVSAPSSAVMSVSVQGCAFSGNRLIALSGGAAGTSHLTLSALNNTFTAGAAGHPQGNQGIQVTASGSGQVTYDITGNDISGLANTGINVFAGESATMSGHVRSNTVTNTGGSGFGIRVFQSALSSVRANVDGNAVSNVGFDYGILAEASGGTLAGQGRMDLALTNNSSSVLSSALDAIRVQVRNTNTLCARVSGNTTDTGGDFSYGLYLRQANTTSTFNLEGLTSGLQTAATTQSYAASQNPGAASVGTIASVGFTGVATGSCNLP